MVKSNKIVAGTEYYDTNNDLQVEDLKKLENYLCRQSQRYKGVVRTSILKSFPFSPRKRLTENFLGQSKGSWKVMGAIKKAFVMMTGTGGSVTTRMPRMFLLIQEVLTYS
jgi:hypothetical protein